VAITTLLSLSSLWSHPEFGHFSQFGHFLGTTPQMPKRDDAPLFHLHSNLAPSHRAPLHPESGRDYPPLLHQTLALNLTLSQSKVQGSGFRVSLVRV